MSTKQPAVVNFSATPRSVELREVPVPEIGAEDVLLEVAAVGVCGSDLHMWTGQQSWKVNYPCVLGHEFAGRIVRRGTNVAPRWREGARVVSETHAVVDPDSPLTRAGLYNLDPNRRGYGAAVDGAMTRFVRVPSRILHHVPDDLPLEHAALSEPCCVAFNATAVNSRILPGDRVLVLGPGPIGVLCAAIARLCGAEVALAGLERDRARLDKARAYGCEVLTGDPLAWCRAGDGLGVDGVIDATGVSAALETALAAVRPAGWITKVGWGPQPVGFSLDPLVQKNVRLQGSFSHHWTIWERVVALLTSGRLDVRPIIGGEWPLEKWHEAFETMHGGAIVKAVLRAGRAMTTFTAECIHPAGAILGEGPMWDAERARLLWVDIERREIHSFNPATGADHVWPPLPHRVGFIVPAARGDFIIGTERGLARFDPQTGALTAVADPDHDRAGNRFNDAKCDPAGRLWAGTMALSEEPDRGSLYRVDADWRITRMVERVSISNGLAWSPDGRTMYYVDSPTRRVDAFDFDPATGDLTNRRMVIEITDGFPDGMCADTAGNLWIALWGGWCVACHNPRTGARLAKVELPVEAVTSCCFGGPCWDELFITTASRDLDTAGHLRQPKAGGIFRARVGVSGPPTQNFAG